MLAHDVSHYSNCISRRCISWWCTDHSGRISSKENPAKATSDEQCVASHHAEKTCTHSNNAQCSPRNCVRTTNRPALELAGSKLTPRHRPNRCSWYVCFGVPWSAIAAFALATTNHTRAQSSIRPACMTPAWQCLKCVPLHQLCFSHTSQVSNWNRYEGNSAWTLHYHRLHSFMWVNCWECWMGPYF